MFQAALLVALALGCQARATPERPAQPPAAKDDSPGAPPAGAAAAPQAPARAAARPAADPGACYAGAGTERFRPMTHWGADYDLPGSRRVAAAEKNKLAEVKRLLQAAGLTFPPERLLLRAFKREKALEVWASGAARDPLVHVATYPICSASGDVGPKTRSGDSQVPEGFYVLDHYKNNSDFYLAMRVSYPNKRDRLLGYTGSAIMIHGHCVSIGCLAMTDERIQELWLLATAVKKRGQVVPVHIFPTCDMAGAVAEAEAAGDRQRRDFWSNLKEGFDQFQKTRRIPAVTVGSKGKDRGRYLLGQ